MAANTETSLTKKVWTLATMNIWIKICDSQNDSQNDGQNDSQRNRVISE